MKLAIFIWRRPGLTIPDFQSYYENHHAPLGLSLTGPMSSYRRNYPIWDDPSVRQALGGFDVMTEVWQENAAALDRQMAARRLEPTRATLDADEATFMDRSRKMAVMLEETGSPPEPGHKQLRFVRAPPGEADAFCAAWAAAAGPGRVCNRVRTRRAECEAPQFDLLEEIWSDALPPPALPGGEVWTVRVREFASQL